MVISIIKGKIKCRESYALIYSHKYNNTRVLTKTHNEAHTEVHTKTHNEAHTGVHTKTHNEAHTGVHTKSHNEAYTYSDATNACSCMASMTDRNVILDVSVCPW